MELAEISRKAVELLLERKITVSLAESCTGGLLAKRITDQPGLAGRERGAAGRLRLLYERGKDAHAGRIGGNAG